MSLLGDAITDMEQIEAYVTLAITEGDFTIFQDVRNPDSVSATFNRIVQFEAPNRAQIHSLPQWVYWLFDDVQKGPARKRLDSLYEGYRELRAKGTPEHVSERQYAQMLDAAALLPTNTTPILVKYIFKDAPPHIRLRFKVGYTMALQMGKDEGIAIQWGAIAAIPHRIENATDHSMYWVTQNWKSSRRHSDYHPLKFRLDPPIAKRVVGESSVVVHL